MTTTFSNSGSAPPSSPSWSAYARPAPSRRRARCRGRARRDPRSRARRSRRSSASSGPGAMRSVSAPRLWPRARRGSTSSEGFAASPRDETGTVGGTSRPPATTRSTHSAHSSSSSSSAGREPPLATSATTPSSSTRWTAANVARRSISSSTIRAPCLRRWSRARRSPNSARNGCPRRPVRRRTGAGRAPARRRLLGDAGRSGRRSPVAQSSRREVAEIAPMTSPRAFRRGRATSDSAPSLRRSSASPG